MMTVRHIRGLLALAAIAACLPVQADEPVPMQRLTPSEIAALAPPPNSGTSAAVQMTVLIGDPTSFYTEPAAQPHFAQTGDEPVVIWVTGYGPSDTKFVTP